MSLSEIVNVVITRETTAVSRAGFGTAIIVGPNVNIATRISYFSTAASAIAAIVGSNTLEEAQINALFGQNPSVTRIALGSLQSSKKFVLTGSMSAGSISATVNNILSTQAFSTDQATTLTALAVKIAADTTNVATAVADATSITITPKAGKVIHLSSVNINYATGVTAATLTATELSEDYDTALGLIKSENNDWYGVVAATRTTSKQHLIADWVESNKKFFIAANYDSNIINQADGADTTSIAYIAKAGALDRTAVIFNGIATEAADAAWFGKILPLDPGSYTAMFKTLSLVTVDSLTETQSTNARSKNAATYETIGGVNITREGKVGSGEFIDVIIFIDWLTARITESVYSVLVKGKKVPFTNAGITAIKGAINVPLKIGQDRGGISPTEIIDGVQVGGYYISAPLASDVPTVDKAIRFLDDVRFVAWLAGAIHSVKINGVVTL